MVYPHIHYISNITCLSFLFSLFLERLCALCLLLEILISSPVESNRLFLPYFTFHSVLYSLFFCFCLLDDAFQPLESHTSFPMSPLFNLAILASCIHDTTHPLALLTSFWCRRAGRHYNPLWNLPWLLQSSVHRWVSVVTGGKWGRENKI